MCLAVPVKVTQLLPEGMVKVQVGEGDTFMNISTLLLPEAPKPGEHVIVHAGFALRVLDQVEAEESLRIFREMIAAGVERE